MVRVFGILTAFLLALAALFLGVFIRIFLCFLQFASTNRTVTVITVRPTKLGSDIDCGCIDNRKKRAGLRHGHGIAKRTREGQDKESGHGFLCVCHFGILFVVCWRR